MADTEKNQTEIDGETLRDAIEVSSDTTISGTDDYTINGGGIYKIAAGYTGTITINTPYSVTLDGSAAGNLRNVQINVTTANAILNLSNLIISNSTSSVIDFGTTTGGTLNVLADTANNLSTSGTYAAIRVGNGLTIGGTGTLTASTTGTGAAIGTNANENSTATIAISNNTLINATATNGAAIGSGENGSIGAINISNGQINATSSNFGAGIGSGYGGSVGSITINGQANVTANSNQGAGVGSGVNGSINSITINGQSTVAATSQQYGAGIGAGYSVSNAASSVGNIDIGGDAQVTATSSSNGVGIGAGAGTNSSVTSINLKSDKDTETKSVVNVTNSDTTRSININGTVYTGATSLKFEDGDWDSQVATKSVTINSGGTYSIPAQFSGEILINTTENVIIDGTNAGNLAGMKISAASGIENINLTINNLTVDNETAC